MAKEFIYKKTKELGKLSDTTTVEVGHYKVDGKEMPDKIYLVNHFTRKNGSEDSKGYCPDAQSRKLLLEATKQLVEYGIEIIPDELGVKETLRKAVQYIKWRDKVLDLVLRLESEEIENYAENINGNAN